MADQNEGRPLEGKRIVVTRPHGRGGDLPEKLERLGAEVSEVPLIEIRPLDDTRELDDAIADPAGYDWVVFTSENAVTAVGIRLGGILSKSRIATVGPATADSVRVFGIEPAFVPDRYVADEIPAGLAPLEGVRVLLPQADIADPALAEELRRAGADVTAVVAYRTVETAPDMFGVLALRVADAIVVASASAARSLAAVADSVATIRGQLVIAIGPRTAAAARERSLPVGLVAQEATAEGIIQTLVTHFQESG
jgi:uroporphyrinogen III methyltransferase / synthase